MAVTMSHPAIRTSPAEPCPFCSCGTPLKLHVKQRATRPSRSASTIGHVKGLPPRFRTDPDYRPMYAPGTFTGHLWLGGQSPRIGDTIGAAAAVAEVSPAYQAHLDAGHVFVSDQTGSYWTDKDGHPLVVDDEARSESEAA